MILYDIAMATEDETKNQIIVDTINILMSTNIPGQADLSLTSKTLAFVVARAAATASKKKWKDTMKAPSAAGFSWEGPRVNRCSLVSCLRVMRPLRVAMQQSQCLALLSSPQDKLVKY